MTLSIQDVLQVAKAQLHHAEASIEAQLLLQHVLKVNRAWLIAHAHDALAPNAHAAFEALLKRRIQGEPIAYILGTREFYGLTLKVTPDTLIPRPDTETLVEAALEKIPLPLRQAQGERSRKEPPHILDLGTGSGAIALAIAQHAPHAHVTAVDASQGALAIAIENANRLTIDNITFVFSHWFEALAPQTFDVIVSNPPYIEAHDAHLSQGDLRFEPITALASGTDGLNDIREIIANSLAHLKPQGWLMLEHGYLQADQVATLMAEAGFIDIQTRQDLGGNDRVTMGKNPLIVNTHWA